MPQDRMTSLDISDAAIFANQKSVAGPKANFNLDAALIRLGGDRELLAALIEIFLEDGPPLMARVQSAYVAPDRSALHLAAHNLRGLASNFDARDVTDPALRLEQLAASGGALDSPGRATLDQLGQAVARLTEGLREFRP
jgi:two-component system sensor histidine kinase/response regulator